MTDDGTQQPTSGPTPEGVSAAFQSADSSPSLGDDRPPKKNPSRRAIAGILASVAVAAVIVGAALLVVMGSTAAKPLAIQDHAFQTQIDKDCPSTNVKITAVSGHQITVGGLVVDADTGKGPSVDLGFGKSSTTIYLFCNGAKHTWIGTLTYAGYTFSSDASDPLQFTVDRKQGYLYVSGKGTATFPDGHVVTLGH